MPKYSYWLTEKTTIYHEVEAESREQADALVEKELYLDGDLDWGIGDMETTYEFNGEVLEKRKPPYEQGYEDGRSDYLANEPDRKSIFDYDCYHDEPDSKDRMMYEEGYEDGFNKRRKK